MTIYLLHSTLPLGGSGPKSASHYLGWSTPNEVLYRIHEHQHGTANCAITNAFLAIGAGLIPVYIRWNGTRAEERYLKRNGHLKKFCPICTPEIRRYALPGEWYLPQDGPIAPDVRLPKPTNESGGDSSPGTPTGRHGWSPRGRYQESTTGSAWRNPDRVSTGGTASSATVPPAPKEDTLRAGTKPPSTSRAEGG